MLAHGRVLPNVRSNYYLEGRLEEMGRQTGWEPVAVWDQNAPFKFLSVQDEELLRLVRHWCKGDPTLIDYFLLKAGQVLAERKAFNFQTQMAVFRRR